MSKNTKNSEYIFTMRNKSKKVNQDGGFLRKKSPDEKPLPLNVRLSYKIFISYR